MEFNKLISKKLHPLLIENGFKLTERSKHIINYELDSLAVVMVHNPREK